MKKMTSFLSLALSTLLIGCATEGPYVPTEKSPSVESENTSVIMDQEIAGLIAVDAQNAERTPKGKLKAMANIRNRSNDDITVQVQTVFRDLNGFSINDDTSWETVVLTANETRTVSAISTSRNAERYTIRVRMMR